MSELIVDADFAAKSSPEARILQAARTGFRFGQGDWDKVFDLLTEYWIDPNAIICTQTGYSLLTLAAIEPAPEACVRLISLGAHPSNGGSIGSRSTLTMMVWLRDGRWSAKHRKIVALLAPYTVNHQDRDGKTALMFAATGAGMFGSKRGNLSIVEQLISFDTDPSIRDRRGRTALMFAVESNNASKNSTNKEVVQLLESYSIDCAAKQWFTRNHRVQFSYSGEIDIAPSKELARPRAIREDAHIHTIIKKMQNQFGLPEGSVALVDRKCKALRDYDTIGMLRKRHS